MKLKHLITKTIVLTFVLLLSTMFGFSVAAQDATSPQLTVVSPGLNVRNGPGVGYTAFAVLTKGNTVPVIGRNANRTWWAVQLEDEQTGWVSGGTLYSTITGNTTTIPEMNQISPTTITSNRNTTTTEPSSNIVNTSHSMANTIVFQTSSGGSIYAINADGSNLHYLTTGIDPALSPDGQQVAFTRWEANQNGAYGNLWLIDINGNNERVIHNNIHQPKSPTWSADGSQIILAMQHGGWIEPKQTCGHTRPPRGVYDIRVFREDDGGFKICYTLPPNPFWGLRLVNVNNGTHEDLPHDSHSFSPAWDPINPWRLIYDGDWGLVALDINQGTTTALTTDVRDHSPAFSPDGSKIVVNYLQQNWWDIHVLNSNGTGRVRLTKTPLTVIIDQQLNGETPHAWNNVSPTWSPDGSQILFLTDRTGRWEIWQMNSNGSNQRPIFSEAINKQLTFNINFVDEQLLNWQ